MSALFTAISSAASIVREREFLAPARDAGRPGQPVRDRYREMPRRRDSFGLRGIVILAPAGLAHVP